MINAQPQLSCSQCFNKKISLFLSSSFMALSFCQKINNFYLSTLSSTQLDSALLDSTQLNSNQLLFEYITLMQWCSAGTFFLQSHFWPGTCSGHSMGWKQMLSELNHDWCVVAAAVETCHEKGQRCSRIKIIETIRLDKYEIYHL